MTELEKLIEQRRELDQKIKEMRSNITQFGSVRISHKETRGGFYNVQTIVKTMSQYDSGERWFVMIRERTKEEVKHSIRVLITDLSELLENLEQEGTECES